MMKKRNKKKEISNSKILIKQIRGGKKDQR